MRAEIEARIAWRRRSGPRLRPTVFVVGAQKAGTTSLHAALASHPRFAMPIVKEIHYFDLAARRGRGWYEAHFPEARGGAGSVLTADATPYYLFHPEVAARLRAYAPEARIIGLLREPARRAWSHYAHERARGYEPLAPEAAFAAEPARVPAPHETVGNTTAARFAHQHHAYCARGEYDRQIARWASLFPAAQLLWLNADTMFADPAATLARVAAFLDIEPFAGGRLPIRNAGDDAAPPPALAGWLNERFAGTRARLAAEHGIAWP